jgi:hypothetical protein
VPTSPIPYDRPRGAIHDLGHLVDLSDARNRLLCVSERSLYIIQNWADMDVGFAARYAIALLDQGYIAVDEGSGEQWSLFISIVENFQMEAQPVDCEIVAALGEIRDAIAALQVNNSTTIDLCCDWLGDVPGGYYGEDGDDSLPSPPPEDKCLAASSWSLNWAEAAIELVRKKNDLGQVSIGVIAAILTAMALPGAALLDILAGLLIALLEWDFDEFQTVVNAAVDDLTCAIFSASSVSGAAQQLEAEIGDLPSLDGAAKNMLKRMVSNAALNQIFSGTYPIRGDAQSDCSECGVVCSAVHIELGLDEVISEESVYAVAEEDPYAWGVAVYFDVFATNGLAFCPYEDGKNITDVTCTNTLATF